MLGNLAFQDKVYVSVDQIGIGTNFADSGTAGQPLQVSGGAYVSGSVGIGTTNPTAYLQIGAGTTSIPPLKLTSGTNLTTVSAGAVEYDGNVFYSTPNSYSGRTLLPSTMYYRLNSAFVGVNTTAVQNMLGVGVALTSNTVYEFEGTLLFNKTAGSVGHGVSIGMTGSASVNNFEMYTMLGISTTGLPLNASSTNLNLGVTTSINNSGTLYTFGTTTTNSWGLIVKGTVNIGTGGTFAPYYQLSAAPGGAYSTVAGSYFKVTPVGIGTTTSANTSIGTWA
jgi:hypothetical protein